MFPIFPPKKKSQGLFIRQVDASDGKNILR